MPFDLTRSAPQRIAVIGGGIAGLSTAWLLSRHHRVTLYEAERRLGGHARTVLAGREGTTPVDTGFIVFNYANYPHLTALFRDLDVPVTRSDMGFAVSLEESGLEYALRSGNALFGQRRNVLRPGFYAMIRDILRFNAGAADAVAGAPDLDIAGLLDQMRLGRAFRDQYLYPICGAIWSTPAGQIGAFPARALLRFMENHALLSARGQHQWWTVRGGSIAYVARLERALVERGVLIRTGAPVARVERGPDFVRIHGRGGGTEIHDQVVLATHADQSLAMLDEPSPAERAALSAVRFQPNRAVLHRDPGVMPRRRRCWSAWVYRCSTGGGIGVSYWMNRLQDLPGEDPLFVTLNPARPIPEEAIYDETVFMHPVFDHAALAAQEALAAMQGDNRSWYAGAWLRNGFHEDGFASAMRIARRLSPQVTA